MLNKERSISIVLIKITDIESVSIHFSYYNVRTTSAQEIERYVLTHGEFNTYEYITVNIMFEVQAFSIHSEYKTSTVSF